MEKVDISNSTLIGLIKGIAVSQIPLLGVPLAMYDSYQNAVQLNNIVDVLTQHERQIQMIQESIDQRYLRMAEHVNDILLTLQKAKDELNGEKRKVYASYLTACCHIENKGDRNKSLYLDYIGRIDFLDFFILRNISNNLNNRCSTDLCLCRYREQSDAECTILDIKIHFNHLESLGLVERCDKEEFENFQKHVGNKDSSHKTFKSKGLYQKTELGKALYNFIGKGVI